MNNRLSLAEKVGSKADLKLKAQNSKPLVLSGLGTMGVIGWSVSVPTLVGAGVGSWLDAHHPGGHSWTLPLLVAGLCMGSFTAWRWITQESKAINL